MNSRYFKPYEIECRCGCGANNFSKETLAKLDNARGLANIPFVLSSACRCEEHNDNEGGKEHSSHISTDDRECTAVDIETKSSRHRFLILESLLLAGFTRIGIAKSFIHADTDSSKASSVTWVYS